MMAKDDKSRYWQMQENFLDAYIGGGCKNGTEAAIEAKYSPKGANRTASRLLTTVDIQKRLAEKLKPLVEARKIDNDRVLDNIAAIAFTDLRDVVEWDGDELKIKDSAEISDIAHHAISEIEKHTTTATAKSENGAITTSSKLKIKMQPKMKALETLARILDMIKKGDDSGSSLEKLDITIRVHPDCRKIVGSSVY